MSDAVRAISALMEADASTLTRQVYNLEAFHPTAAEIEAIVSREFPEARIDYVLDAKRMAIVDSWPASVDDAAARADWGFAPKYTLENAFVEYLFPRIRQHYAG